MGNISLHGPEQLGLLSMVGTSKLHRIPVHRINGTTNMTAIILPIKNTIFWGTKSEQL